MSACTQARVQLDNAVAKRQRPASSDTGGGAACPQAQQRLNDARKRRRTASSDTGHDAALQALEAKVKELEQAWDAVTEALCEKKTAAWLGLLRGETLGHSNIKQIQQGPGARAG